MDKLTDKLFAIYSIDKVAVSVSVCLLVAPLDFKFDLRTYKFLESKPPGEH